MLKVEFFFFNQVPNRNIENVLADNLRSLLKFTSLNNLMDYLKEIIFLQKFFGTNKKTFKMVSVMFFSILI